MNTHSPSVAEQAKALLESVERTLEEDEERLLQMGWSPTKLRQFSEQTLSPKQRRQAEDKFRADMDDVEQAAAEAKARLQTIAHGTGTVVSKARRRFI